LKKSFDKARSAGKDIGYQNQKVGCALSGFCFTLICLNTTKTRQDPCAKVGGKIWGACCFFVDSSVLREAYSIGFVDFILFGFIVFYD
tara:strand:- start:7165 stop:7428 length:264 start_codon:yes stop_codon:yes gene_type:complete